MTPSKAAALATLASAIAATAPAAACDSINVKGNNNSITCTIITLGKDRSTGWLHNGSLVRLTAVGRNRQFFYVLPRSAIRARGASSGTLLFDGVRDGDAYSGTAYVFTTNCGKFPYYVWGPLDKDRKGVTLTGEAPLIDRHCRVVGYRPDTLVFSRIEE